MENLLAVEHLSKTYSGITVLKNVFFTLKRGEVHALVGENGAGKSTLIKVISGVEAPDPGSIIVVDGKRVHGMTPEKSTALGISVIYQDISLFPNMSIAENLVIGRYRKQIVNKKQIIDFAKKAFKNVDLEMDLDKRVCDLSVGQQQLVAIVRAISFEAKVIIMDEPTAALSPSEVKILFNIIENLKRMNIGVIYISHKLEEIFAVADRISVLRDGEIVSSGPASEYDSKLLIQKMVGRELRFVPMKKAQHSEDVLFEIRDLRNSFVDIPSLKIHKYEIVGLTGLVGAGRSELAQTIFGILRAEDGEIYVHGKKIQYATTKQATKGGIGYLPENRISQGLFYGQNIIMNTTSASLDHFSGMLSFLNSKKELRSTQEYINALEVRPQNPQALIESFSGGNQQKILIGRWLAADPKVLIVDEPTSGVDVGAKLAIHKYIRGLADNGMAILLISSDLPEVMAISDRILVMRNGRIVAEVNADEATDEVILEAGLMG